MQKRIIIKGIKGGNKRILQREKKRSYTNYRKKTKRREIKDKRK